MYQKTYYVDKTTHTFADVLVAYGLTELLAQLIDQADEDCDVWLKDEGAYYSINLEVPLQATWIENCRYFSLVPLIVTAKMKKAATWPTDIRPFVDYEAEKERNSRYFEGRKQLPPEAKRPGASPDEYPELRALLDNKPRPDWPILAQINQMSALPAYNGMVSAWYDNKNYFVDHLKLMLQLFATSPNPIDDVEKAWKTLAKEHSLSTNVKAAATQVFNPATGKGANRAKANGLSIGGQKNLWLLEYLKLIGMRQAGIPRVASGSKDRKTYVLLPVNIERSTNNRVFQTFNDQFWPSSAVKMDILAAIRYAQLFLNQWRDGQLSKLQKLQGGQLGNHISGLAVVFYKDMGSAHAVLNQSTIHLPRWVDKVETKEDANLFLAMLAEHESIIQALEENIGPEYDLLCTYRNFLSARDLDYFFNFTAAYSSYLTNRIENKKYINQFTTPYLEVLIMSQQPKLKTILETPGFKNIAKAIRQSTINPQWAKARGNKRIYDIRYGLGNTLKRKANYNQEFTEALTDFMHSYNQETVQEAENHKGNPPIRRSQLTVGDIDEIIALIDEFGAKTVGNMLVAYGYARDPKEKKDQDTEETPNE